MSFVSNSLRVKKDFSLNLFPLKLWFLFIKGKKLRLKHTYCYRNHSNVKQQPNLCTGNNALFSFKFAMCSKSHPKYQTLYRAENIHTVDTKVEPELQSKPKIYNQIFNMNQSKNLNPKISVRFGLELQLKWVEFPNSNILEPKLRHSARAQPRPVMLWKNLNQTTGTETWFAHPKLECLCGEIAVHTANIICNIITTFCMTTKTLFFLVNWRVTPISQHNIKN